jgi:hypothetical protein
MESEHCPFDPIPYANMPLGMFHCPLCSEMVIAGMAHPKPFNDEDFEEVHAETAVLKTE